MKFVIELTEASLEHAFLEGYLERKDKMPIDVNPYNLTKKHEFKRFTELHELIDELADAWNQGWFDAHNVETVHIETGDSNV